MSDEAASVARCRCYFLQEHSNWLAGSQFNGRRTTDGIAAEVGVPRPAVLAAIRRDRKLAKTVKVCPFRAEDGRPFVSTKERFYKEATLVEKIVDFLATERVQLG